MSDWTLSRCDRTRAVLNPCCGLGSHSDRTLGPRGCGVSANDTADMPSAVVRSGFLSTRLFVLITYLRRMMESN
jgi:hypothetical protein